MRIRVFHRKWWKPNPSWPQGKEPDSRATKTTIGHVDTEDEAREVCRAFNADRSDDDIKWGRKAEWTRA